jgi:hypothetical protein
MDDWEDADVWRLAAEQAYITALDKATRIRDDNSLKAFPGLREELDQLGEDEVEDDCADETMNLPLLPPSEQTPTVKVDWPTENISNASSVRKEARQKTHKAKKGGAYHMHSFTKSLGKSSGSGSGSVRASVLSMDWEANKEALKNADGGVSLPGQ